MPNQDDEQEKNQGDEVFEVADASETAPEDKQQADKPDEAPENSESTGELGDEEQVMGDSEPPKRPGKIKRFFAGYWRHKKWTLLLTLLAIVGILFAVPTTRYPLLALKMKRSFAVLVLDSKTHTLVSGAKVTLDGQTITTNSGGSAIFYSKVGKQTLTVGKQYYKSFSETVFVGVTHTGANARGVQLVATGRQVSIKVVNKITGAAVMNAEIKVLDTEAKTDASGMATIVLPTGTSTLPASISAAGYNNLSGKVEIIGQASNIAFGSMNTFQLTSSGRVYFLSNLSGNIDVVSTNLDGSSRKTVLAGTGAEDPNNTVLLASRDWKYLALLSKRDGGQYAKLYLINTSNNQLTTMDEGTAAFTPVGWSEHYFVYQVNRTNVHDWQSGQYALKSFNADTNKIAVITQTSAQGVQVNYASQNLESVNIVNDRVVYGLAWAGVASAGDPSYNTAGKHDSILSANADGTNKHDLRDIALPRGTIFSYLNSVQYKPETLYIQTSVGQSNAYYTYQYQNDSVTQNNTITDNIFNQAQQNYVTYLVSPTGNQTFWSEQRDGKNTLFVGDATGNNGKQIATLSDYTTYGWYTDNYLLVEKGGSELYVMPTGGGTALKISDYYKPAQNFNGYGGGYGGL